MENTETTFQVDRKTTIPVLNTLRECRKGIEELRTALDNYFHSKTTIPYLEETREIAFSIQELLHGHECLSKDFLKALKTEQDLSFFHNKLNSLKSESNSVEKVLQALIKT